MQSVPEGANLLQEPITKAMPVGPLAPIAFT